MKHNKLTSLIINAMSAMVAAAQIRWNKQREDKKYLKHGAHVAVPQDHHRRAAQTGGQETRQCPRKEQK